MSDPAAPGDPLPAPRPAAPLRPARWLDRLSVLFLCAGLVGATAAATPSLLRAYGFVEPPAPTMPPPASARPPQDPPRGTSYAYDDHPRFLLDDEPRITQLERLQRGDDRPGEHAGRVEVPVSPTKPRAGVARSPLTVRERADVLAEIRGRVPAGAPITLLLEKGEWALIAHRTPDGTTLGWTARSAIVVP